jgi:hypothetical protein
MYILAILYTFTVQNVFKIDTIIYRNKLFTDEIHYLVAE